jgi:hypothetical protein
MLLVFLSSLIGMILGIIVTSVAKLYHNYTIV